MNLKTALDRATFSSVFFRWNLRDELNTTFKAVINANFSDFFFFKHFPTWQLLCSSVFCTCKTIMQSSASAKNYSANSDL